MPERFDPFNNRLARDIRNSLSKSLVAALTHGNPGDMEETAARWLAGNPPPAGCRYIQDRQKRYREVLEDVRQKGIVGNVEKALVLWNRKLLFETHELLEEVWQAASGGRRQALKGLIQAAGVFVHVERGHQKAACRLADRSRDLLRCHGHHLPEIANLNELVKVLESRSPKAPMLIGSPAQKVSKGN